MQRILCYSFLNNSSFAVVYLYACLLTYVCLVEHFFCAYGCSITPPFSVSLRFCPIGNPLAFLCAFAFLLILIYLVCMFLYIWLLDNHYFSLSLHFCLFINHPLACCPPFCAFESAITPLSVFLSVFSNFLTILLLVVYKHSLSVSLHFC